jgi:hypothetical protein
VFRLAVHLVPRNLERIEEKAFEKTTATKDAHTGHVSLIGQTDHTGVIAGDQTLLFQATQGESKRRWSELLPHPVDHMRDHHRLAPFTQPGDHLQTGAFDPSPSSPSVQSAPVRYTMRDVMHYPSSIRSIRARIAASACPPSRVPMHRPLPASQCTSIQYVPAEGSGGT